VAPEAPVNREFTMAFLSERQVGPDDRRGHAGELYPGAPREPRRPDGVAADWL